MHATGLASGICGLPIDRLPMESNRLQMNGLPMELPIEILMSCLGINVEGTPLTERHGFGPMSNGFPIENGEMSLRVRTDEGFHRTWCVSTEKFERNAPQVAALSCVPPSHAARYAMSGDLVVSRHAGEVRLYQGNKDYRRGAAPLLGLVESEIRRIWFDPKTETAVGTTRPRRVHCSCGSGARGQLISRCT